MTINKPPYQGSLFFDTAGESKEELKTSVFRAQSQNTLVLNFFKSKPGKKFTPMQVWLFLVKKDKKILLGSVRRVITVLTKMDLLLHYKNIKKKESYGHTNGSWQYNSDYKKEDKS